MQRKYSQKPNRRDIVQSLVRPSGHQRGDGGAAEGQSIKAHPETPGAPVTPGIVLDLMQEKGFDLSGNTRNQVTPEMVDSADRIILMLGRIPPEDFLSQSEKRRFGTSPTLRI